MAIDDQWKLLTESLNIQGPPVKTTNEWKKTWAEIPKKLAHNKRETIEAVGGDLKKYTLSEMEEVMVQVSGIYKVIDGISGTTSYGIGEESNCDLNLIVSDDEMPSTSHQMLPHSQNLPPTPKRRKKEPSLQETVNDFMNKGAFFHKSLIESVTQCAKTGKEVEISLRKVYSSLHKINSTMRGIRKDINEHHLKMQQALDEKNQIKLRRLED